MRFFNLKFVREFLRYIEIFRGTSGLFDIKKYITINKVNLFLIYFEYFSPNATIIYFCYSILIDIKFLYIHEYFTFTKFKALKNHLISVPNEIML